MTTSYDEVDYPSYAFRQTHPERLACLAHQFGIAHAPATRCRVLDIGAGDGGNIIPMAYQLPEARFVGFDLAGAPVDRGRGLIEAIGLENIELRQGDILDIDLGPEPFDYIISHGVYAWTPEPVREGLLALIGRALAPDGLAVVSYNVLPGCRVRQVVRDLLLYRLRNVQGARGRMEAAIDCLEDVVATFPKDDAFSVLVANHARKLLERPAEVLAHDELGEDYHPVHLHEFLGAAARYDLTYLTDALGEESGEGFLPPHALDDPAFDVVDFAQRQDFREGRGFRYSVLMRAGRPLDRKPDPSRLFDLHACAPIQGAAEPGTFNVSRAQFEVKDPVLLSAVEAMAAAWPNTVAVRDLVSDPEHAAPLQRMFWAGLIDLQTTPAVFADGTGPRPEASAVARRQAAAGWTRLTCLNHGTVEVTDPFSLAFIAGLDGSRTRDEIARDIAPKLGVDVDNARGQLDGQLRVMAKMPLLVA